MSLGWWVYLCNSAWKHVIFLTHQKIVTWNIVKLNRQKQVSVGSAVWWMVCAEMVWFKQNLIQTYMHTCRHAYPHACILHIHPCMHGSISIYIYIYIGIVYIYICINCIYIYIGVCVCARACVCVRARIHMSMIPCWVASPCLAMDCCSLLFLFPMWGNYWAYWGTFALGPSLQDQYVTM